MTATTELPATASVVVIGGGVIGLSAAHHLAAAGVEQVVLVEAGALGEGSTCRAAGGVRATFSDEVNVELGLLGLEAFERFGVDFDQEIDLEQPGYLFLLRDDSEVAAFERGREVQSALGVGGRFLDVTEIRDRVPFVDPSDLVAGYLSPRGGHCTPESVVLGYARAARRAGVRILTHCPVTGIRTAGGRIAEVLTDRGGIATATVLCAAGAWSEQVGGWAGVPLPVRPLVRQIAVTEPVANLPGDLPFTIDFASSFYFHREGDGLLMGMRDPEDRWTFGATRTETWLAHLAEAIEHRVPALGDIGIASGWAGLYEMTPDCNALIGEAREVDRFLYATGFSGHGFLMGPGVGRVMADLYLRRTPSVDVSSLAHDRFLTASTRPEHTIV